MARKNAPLNAKDTGTPAQNPGAENHDSAAEDQNSEADSPAQAAQERHRENEGKTSFPNQGPHYRALQEGIKRMNRGQGFPTITNYLGALLSSPNHAESEFSEGILKDGMKEWERQQPDVVQAIREFVATCKVAPGPDLKPALHEAVGRRLHLVLMLESEAVSRGVLSAPKRRVRQPKNGGTSRGGQSDKESACKKLVEPENEPEPENVSKPENGNADEPSKKPARRR